MATINVKDASDSVVAIEKPLAPGRASAAESRPVVLSTEDKAALDAVATSANQDTSNTHLSTIAGAISSSRAAVNPIPGQAGVAAGSGLNGSTVQRVTIATDDQTAAHINNALIGEYETVAASQTDQALGATGATGDFLAGVLIVPATASPGAVSIKDGSGSAITVFTGGSNSVTNLVPFFIPLGIKSGSGAWKVTTGNNVSAICVGNFT